MTCRVTSWLGLGVERPRSSPNKIRNGLPWRSSENEEFARLHERSRFYPVEVHATREIPSVELHFVIPRTHYIVDQLRDLLAECVEDYQSDVRAIGETIADRGRGIEGVGVVL